MNHTFPMKIRARRVPTPLVLEVPLSPVHGLWPPTSNSIMHCPELVQLKSLESSKTLAPYMTDELSGFTTQSSASLHTGGSFSSVDDWSEISLLSDQILEHLSPPQEPSGLPLSSTASAEKPLLVEKQSVTESQDASMPANAPNPNTQPIDFGLRRAATQPTGMSVTEARQYLTKLRSRSLAALQLEGHRVVPHSPPGPTLIDNMRPQERFRWQPPRLPPLNTNLVPPPFTPSMLFEASPEVERASPMVEHPRLPRPFQAQWSMQRPQPSSPLRGPLHEVQRDRKVSERLALPALPRYVPIEGLDTQQDERLRQRRSRNGVVFTVAGALPVLPSSTSNGASLRCM